MQSIIIIIITCVIVSIQLSLPVLQDQSLPVFQYQHGDAHNYTDESYWDPNNHTNLHLRHP